MPDGNARRRGDDDLPPDPWAGLADPAPPPPPDPTRTGWQHPSGPSPDQWAAGRGTGATGATDEPWGPSDPAAPLGPSGAPGRHVPPPRRTIWHHPAVWVALLVVAAILLIGALLEPRRPAPSEPSPDAVTAAASHDTTTR